MNCKLSETVDSLQEVKYMQHGITSAPSTHHVKETATTTSDAHDLPHAEHGRKARTKLTRYDRMMARRKPKKGWPGSKGYREAKLLRAKAHKEVARQREDTGRKWAKKALFSYSYGERTCSAG